MSTVSGTRMLLPLLVRAQALSPQPLRFRVAGFRVLGFTVLGFTVLGFRV